MSSARSIRDYAAEYGDIHGFHETKSGRYTRKNVFGNPHLMFAMKAYIEKNQYKVGSSLPSPSPIPSCPPPPPYIPWLHFSFLHAALCFFVTSFAAPALPSGRSLHFASFILHPFAPPPLFLSLSPPSPSQVMKDAEKECDRVYFQAKHAMYYLNKLIEENEDFKCDLAHAAEFPIKVGLMQVWLGRCFGMTYCPNKKGIAHETHERADVLQAKDIYIFANARRELQGLVWHTVEFSSLEGTKSPMVSPSLPPLPVASRVRSLLPLLLLCYILTVAPPPPPPPSPSSSLSRYF